MEMRTAKSRRNVGQHGEDVVIVTQADGRGQVTSAVSQGGLAVEREIGRAVEFQPEQLGLICRALKSDERLGGGAGDESIRGGDEHEERTDVTRGENVASGSPLAARRKSRVVPLLMARETLPRSPCCTPT